MSEWHYNPSHGGGGGGPVQFGPGARGPPQSRDQKFPLSSPPAAGAGVDYHSAGSVTFIHESVSTRTQYSVVPVQSSAMGSIRGSVDLSSAQQLMAAGGSHQQQHNAARAALASGVHRVHLAEATPQSFSYSSTGAVNWKALWNALLSGQHNALRRWVAELPIKGCKVDAAGRLDVASSVLPASFALQLNEMLAKAVPPLADLVIDALCWRGIFLPSELCNFDLLSVRLARNGLLFRPAGRRELKPLSLEKFLPFGTMSPFHKYMLTKRLRPDRFQYAVLRKAYVSWYKLGPFLPEVDEIVARMERQAVAAAGRAAGAKFLLSAGAGAGASSAGAGWDFEQGTAPTLLSTTASLDTDLGTFVQGLGYIVGYDAETGAPLFGDEDAGVEALRAEQARADADLAASIDAEIDAMQTTVAGELTRPNFNMDWLRSMGLPQLRVHPTHIHHARVARALHADIESILPPGGKSAVLKNGPTDQIVMLVLYELYRCSATRALRVAAPMLAASAGSAYPLLSSLVAKMVLACSSVRNKGARRAQANALHFLKMVQQYTFSLPPSNSRPEGDEHPDDHPEEDGEQVPDASDPGATLHGMPLSQNEPLLLSMILDVSGLIARYCDATALLNEPSLAALLPPRGTHELLASGAERAHLPALLWAVWVAFQRRRNSRLPSLARRMPPEDGSVDTEGPHDSRVISWFLALVLHLYQVVSSQRKTVSAAPAAVAPRPGVDAATLAFLAMGLHMLALEPYPRGMGEVLRAEFALGAPGGSAMFVRAFLWFGGIAQEEPPALVQRLLQLQAEKFFEGDWSTTAAAGANGGFMEDLPDQSGSGRARRALQGHACLQHLCVVLAPYSAILLASRPADSAEARATALQLQERPSSVSAATAGAAGHAALVAAESAPVWDPTSEALLRVAYDPFTAHVLGLTAPAKASYLLSRANGDAGVITLACGIGASSADSMLAWLKRNQPELLQGLPELPAPGGRAGPPAFHERSLPLEKALLRLVRAGCWYTLRNGFDLFAPHNILGRAVEFLKLFTQRRYIPAAQALQETFAALAESRALAQPSFGRKHFFAVVGAGPDVRSRNLVAYQWTQRVLVSLTRAGLLIGMQGNIPSSHRMGSSKTGSAPTAPRGGFTSIDLTDYDRNYLLDLFQGLLARHASSSANEPDSVASASTVLTQAMVNEVLSVIPPTVSSSFLLNITSIAHNALLGVNRTQSQTQRYMVHRLKWRQHRHAMWSLRLTSWREQEGYYTRKMHDLLALLELERVVGVSLEERNRLVRFWSREQGELGVAPQICAALWYQAALHFYRNSHPSPDALVPAVSNSSAEAARGDARAGAASCSGSGMGSAQDAAAAAATSVASAMNAATDSEGLRTGANVEQSAEVASCSQEILLLFLAHQSWQECFDQLHQDLEEYFAAHPAARPVPVRMESMPEGAAAAAGMGETETTPALDNSGRPILLPPEIESKLQQRSQYLFVLRRVRGRLYWLMLLHGMSNVRNKETSRVEFDLNDPAEVTAWRARQAEREAAAHQRATDRVIAAAEREAARRGRRDERTLRAQARALTRAAKQAQAPQPKSSGGGGPGSMPPTPPDSDDDNEEEDESSFDSREEASEARIRAQEDEAEAEALEADQDPDDDLCRPLWVEFSHVQRLHFAEGSALGTGATASPGGVSRGLEKFQPLPPGQYLPWGGSSLSNPSSAVLEAQARHKAAAFAFDEDMDVTRLSPAELVLIGEYSVDTRMLLAVVEELLHLRMFRSALRVVADVLERFPLLRHAPRVQAALSLVDMVQLLFFLAHPSLQDVRVNQVLSGQSGAPFAGGPASTQLSISEELDPFARCYGEVLDWPLVRHVLREEEQTWLRMRWYASSNHSNHTLILQRLLIDSPSIYQNILLSLLFARGDGHGQVTTVYSRTRPVAVELHANESARDGDSGGNSFTRSLMGTMKSIGDAIKGTGADPSRSLSPSSASASGPGGSDALDVEHLRQWMLTLDEAGRVELLDRFVQMSNDPMAAPLTASRSVAAASGAAAAAATLGSPSHAGGGGGGGGIGGTSHARSPSTAGSRAHSEPLANPHFTALTRRHLPLLCEVAQTLAMSLRVARVELIKPRNKKLAPLPPGLRVSGQQFMVVLATILVKTRTLSVRLPSSVPLHYSSRERLHPDRNAPTTAWALNLAENLSLPLLSLLGMHPAEVIHHLWTSGRGAERAAILTLLRSGQIYYHFMNHHNFASLDRDLHGADVCAALVEALLKAVTNADKRAGPPSPFRNFQQGEWWGREELVAYIGLADRSEPLALPTLAAAFRAQAFVLIKARDPAAAVTSALLGPSGGGSGGSAGADGVHDLGEAHSSASRVAAGLLGWWQGPRDPSRPFLHGHGLDEFLRLSPGTCVEFELLYASYISFLAGGRVHEMRQVARDIRSGLQSLLTCVQTKSRAPAPPVITSPTNPDETIAPPFAGASLVQIEALYLARLQLERAATIMCHDAEMRDVIAGLWRMFRKKAPQAFA